MTKNKFEDLHNHLFAQLERLGDEDTKGDDLKEELERADAITKVASQIISNGSLMLQVFKIKANGIADAEIPKLWLGKD